MSWQGNLKTANILFAMSKVIMSKVNHVSCSQGTMMLYVLIHGHQMPSMLQEHARYATWAFEIVKLTIFMVLCFSD